MTFYRPNSFFPVECELTSTGASCDTNNFCATKRERKRREKNEQKNRIKDENWFEILFRNKFSSSPFNQIDWVFLFDGWKRFLIFLHSQFLASTVVSFFFFAARSLFCAHQLFFSFN